MNLGMKSHRLSAGSETHINCVEGLAEEEHGPAERQRGAGVRAGPQLLVSGFLSELEQPPELQSPARSTQAQQAPPDPQPDPPHPRPDPPDPRPDPGPGTHLLPSEAPHTRSDQRRGSPVKEAGEEVRAAGDTSSRDSGGLEGSERREGGMSDWRREE